MIAINPEFKTQYYMGADWPQFQVRPGYLRNRDGAPVIYCVHINGMTHGSLPSNDGCQIGVVAA